MNGLKDKGMPDAQASAALALRALEWLLRDDGRRERFMAMTGCGPEDLRAAAETPWLLAAVLEYLLGDESLLLAFCADCDIAPDMPRLAHLRLTRG